MIVLRAATESDCPFIFECLRELRGQAEYSLEDLRMYLGQRGMLDTGVASVRVAVDGPELIGMLTVNRYAMPRYLGYGIDLEEVIVHPSCQRRGYGAKILAAFLQECGADPHLRRVTVRTDDPQGAGRLYARYFTATSLVVYARGVNPI